MQVKGLEEQLERRSQELDAARRECTEKDHELASKLETALRERAQVMEDERNWEQKYHEHLG